MTAPDPATIVQTRLVPPIDIPAEAASRAAWIDRQMHWHRLAPPAPRSEPRDRFGLVLAASAAAWLLAGWLVWSAWPMPTQEFVTVAPRDVVQVAP
jgi:hypothetical protein